MTIADARSLSTGAAPTGLVDLVDKYSVNPNAPTVDQSTAIQRALTNEQFLWVPAGIYGTAAGLKSGGANQVVVGAGRAHSVFRALAGCDALWELQTNHQMCEIEGIGLDGNNIANYGLILDDQTAFTSVRRCQIQRCTGVGGTRTFTPGGGAATTLTTGSGVCNQDRCNSSLFDDCHLNNNVIGALFQNRAQYSCLRNCKVYFNTSGRGVVLDGASNYAIGRPDHFVLFQADTEQSGTGTVNNSLYLRDVRNITAHNYYCEPINGAGSTSLTLDPTTGRVTEILLLGALFSGAANTEQVLITNSGGIGRLHFLGGFGQGYTSLIVDQSGKAQVSYDGFYDTVAGYPLYGRPFAMSSGYGVLAAGNIALQAAAGTGPVLGTVNADAYGGTIAYTTGTGATTGAQLIITLPTGCTYGKTPKAVKVWHGASNGAFQWAGIPASATSIQINATGQAPPASTSITVGFEVLV